MKNFIKKIYQFFPFKMILFRTVRRIYTPPFYKYLPVKGIFKLFWSPTNYFLIFCNYKFFMENELFWLGFYGGWEKKSLELWVKLCRHSNIVFDIGANTGIYSLTAKSVKPDSKVYAFEPISNNVDVLKYNNSINNFDIKINDVAISNSDGQAVMYALPDTINYMTSINKNRYNNKEVSETIVTTVTLSSFIKGNRIEKVDLIKIDVEEHEYEVIIGLGNLIESMKPDFLVEIIGDENGKKIKNLFTNTEYIFFVIDEVNEPQLVNNIIDKEHHNYLICLPETAKKINLI